MVLWLAIRRCRTAKNLTQAQLAVRSGLARSSITAFENNARRPSLLVLKKLASGMGIKFTRLLGEVPPTVQLNRFEKDRLCKSLVENRPWNHKYASILFADLYLTFRWKLKALYPTVSRPKLRISANAAKKRLKSNLGAEVLREITQRLDKCYPRPAQTI
jgi:transcriptional regulator with XRE-family HTH domain